MNAAIVTVPAVAKKQQRANALLVRTPYAHRAIDIVATCGGRQQVMRFNSFAIMASTVNTGACGTQPVYMCYSTR